MYHASIYLCLNNWFKDQDSNEPHFTEVVVYIASSNSVTASPVDGGDLFNSFDVEEVRMPDSCKNQNYCFDKGDNYPETKIQELLRKLPGSLKKRVPRSLGFRQSDPKEDPDCPVNNTRVDDPIYYIRDEKNKVRVVVQAPTFQQIFSVKWCARPGKITVDTPNFMKGSPILKKYNIECVNTNMDFDFFVLDDGIDLTLDSAKVKDGVPVCCRCKYSRITN